MAGDKALDKELVKELDWDATLLAIPSAALPFVEKRGLLKYLFLEFLLNVLNLLISSKMKTL